MRILHLVSYPLYSGPLPGVLALAAAQQAAGHKVYFACDLIRGNFDGFEEAARPRLVQAGLKPPPGPRLSLSTKATLRQNWADWRALRALLHGGSIDIVHTHMSHDHALVALAGRGSALHVRTLHATRNLRWRPGQAALLRCANAFIVRCVNHAQKLHDRFAVPSTHIQCIPGSVDARAWVIADAAERSRRGAAFRATHNIPGDVPLLGQVALIEHRGQEEVLAALALLPAIPQAAAPHVVFVGDGAQAGALRAQATALGLSNRAHFTGYLPHESLRNAYAAVDACVVMQAGNDAAVRAALEALAAGRPVLAPSVDALGETVDTAVGYRIVERTAASVAVAMAQWLADLDAAAQRGQVGAARMLLARSVKAESEATLDLYRSASRLLRTDLTC
jgi:glycosyltransferase involved in cell wall biosynthesis